MTYMVTLALALVTFSDKSKHVFYDKKKKKQTAKQNRVRTNEAASPGVRFWKKRMKLKSRLNSQRGAAK